MNPFIPFHSITPLQSMMIQIKDDGQYETWQYIETIKNPLQRAEARKLFAQAVKKLEEN
ncbi:MAG: hypothetical protein WC516_06365 [Patescibacteria group bacterium]|jgi:hypothetical protein